MIRRTCSGVTAISARGLVQLMTARIIEAMEWGITWAATKTSRTSSSPDGSSPTIRIIRSAPVGVGFCTDSSSLPSAGIDASRHGQIAEVPRKNAGQAIITCDLTRSGCSLASHVVHSEPIDWVTKGAGPMSSASSTSARKATAVRRNVVR